MSTLCSKFVPESKREKKELDLKRANKAYFPIGVEEQKELRDNVKVVSGSSVQLVHTHDQSPTDRFTTTARASFSGEGLNKTDYYDDNDFFGDDDSKELRKAKHLKHLQGVHYEMGNNKTLHYDTLQRDSFRPKGEHYLQEQKKSILRKGISATRGTPTGQYVSDKSIQNWKEEDTLTTYLKEYQKKYSDPQKYQEVINNEHIESKRLASDMRKEHYLVEPKQVQKNESTKQKEYTWKTTESPNLPVYSRRTATKSDIVYGNDENTYESKYVETYKRTNNFEVTLQARNEGIKTASIVGRTNVSLGSHQYPIVSENQKEFKRFKY